MSTPLTRIDRILFVYAKNNMTFETVRSTQEASSLHSLVSRHCAHIRKPYTLEEICEQLEGGEYNAELMLQHLLRWVSANAQTLPTEGAAKKP